MALPRDLQASMASLNKEMGEHTVIVASDMRPPERITTGSLALDAALGGGWPVNQWHEIIGDPSAGKTCTVLKTIAANQENDPNFVATWVASEYFDKGYAEMCGCDTSRIVVVNENVTERAFKVALLALDERWGDVLVIDSLPAMSPGEEAEKEMEDFQIGLQARLTNKFFRKQGTSGKRSMVTYDRGCTCFLVNQWRDRIGVMWGDPRTTPGGKGKDYAAYTRMEVRRDDWIEVGPKSSKIRVGQTIKSRIIKNKSFPPQKVATYDFYFEDSGSYRAGEYDIFKEVCGLGVVYGVIDQAGSWFTYGGLKAQGLPNLIPLLASDMELTEVLKKEVLAAATGKPYAHVDDLPEIDTTEIEIPATTAPAPARRTVARRPKK